MKVSVPSNSIFLPSSELRFGFLASSVVNNLESDNYQIRLAAIKDLVSTVQTTASNQIDVDRFLDFIMQFLDDDNIMIAEKSCSVIESLCYNLYGNAALYKNHLLKMAVSHLGSKKKFLTLFAQNILHIMIKSISPQIILSDVFSMTLMSPPRTLTSLFNFVTNEVKTGIVAPSILTKYAFILEDALNSDDRNLVESAQNCLQEIKIKDFYTYETIAQRIKTAYINSTSVQNTSSNNTKNLGFKTQTYSNFNYLNSSSSDYKQPFLTPVNNHYTKMNRSFISHATFALAEEDNIELSTSKPSSADDSRVSTSKVSIGDSNDLNIPQIYDDLNIDNQSNQFYNENLSKKTIKTTNNTANIIDKQKITKSNSSPKTRLLKIYTAKS